MSSRYGARRKQNRIFREVLMKKRLKDPCEACADMGEKIMCQMSKLESKCLVRKRYRSEVVDKSSVEVRKSE